LRYGSRLIGITNTLGADFRCRARPGRRQARGTIRDLRDIDVLDDAVRDWHPSVVQKVRLASSAVDAVSRRVEHQEPRPHRAVGVPFFREPTTQRETLELRRPTRLGQAQICSEALVMSSKTMFDLLTAFGSFALAGGLIGLGVGAYNHAADVWGFGAGGALLGLIAQGVLSVREDEAKKRQIAADQQRYGVPRSVSPTAGSPSPGKNLRIEDLLGAAPRADDPKPHAKGKGLGR
jgi:hypothetical protein